MNNNKYNRLRDLPIFYLPSAIFKSFLTGLIFFIFPATLLVTLTVNVMLLYVYHLLYILIGLYILLVILSFFTNRVIISTLKNYGDRSDEIAYDRIHLIISIIAALLLLVLFTIIYTYVR